MSLKFVPIAATLLTATLAHAQATQIPAHAVIYSAEGTKLGRIEDTVSNADGSPQAVKLIYRGKFIMIPVSTLSAEDKGFKTSLDNVALKHM